MDIAMFEYYSMSRYPQFPETILNKIEKTFNKTKKGLKNFLQRFQTCFSQNPSSNGVESTSWAVQPIRPELGQYCTAA